VRLSGSRAKVPCAFSLIVIFLVLIAAIPLARQTAPIAASVLDTLLLDEVEREPPCDRLPSAARVRRVLAEHRDDWERVRGLSEWTTVETSRCPGKASLEIYYTTQRDRAEIERLIGATFFGVPYRVQNV
jgi:hypothetical protein